MNKYPLTPRITIDSYISIWSMADALPCDHTYNWTGQRSSMTGAVIICRK